MALFCHLLSSKPAQAGGAALQETNHRLNLNDLESQPTEDNFQFSVYTTQNFKFNEIVQDVTSREQALDQL